MNSLVDTKKTKQKYSVTECSEILMEKIKNENTKNGTGIHKHIEKYLVKNKDPILLNPQDEKTFKNFKEFMSCINHLTLHSVEQEIIYTYKEKTIVGKIDAVFKYPSKKEYYIIDWKIMYDLDDYKMQKYEAIMNMYMKMFKNYFKDSVKVFMYIVILDYRHESFIAKEVNTFDITLDNLLGKLFI